MKKKIILFATAIFLTANHATAETCEEFFKKNNMQFREVWTADGGRVSESYEYIRWGSGRFEKCVTGTPTICEGRRYNLNGTPWRIMDNNGNDFDLFWTLTKSETACVIPDQVKHGTLYFTRSTAEYSGRIKGSEIPLTRRQITVEAYESIKPSF